MVSLDVHQTERSTVHSPSFSESHSTYFSGLEWASRQHSLSDISLCGEINSLYPAPVVLGSDSMGDRFSINTQLTIPTVQESFIRWLKSFKSFSFGLCLFTIVQQRKAVELIGFPHLAKCCYGSSYLLEHFTPLGKNVSKIRHCLWKVNTHTHDGNFEHL